MASAKKKQRKNGSFFYEISVSRGYSKSPYTMRWDIPEGLATKTVKARLRDVAAKFEQDCKNGKVKTRKERKEELQQAELKRILDEKNRMTFKRYCEETFLPDIRQRCSENTIYNYRLQLEKHVYPDIGQLEMQGIKAGDINQLLRKHQAASDSLSTPIKVYTIVRAVMKMAYKDELIEHNPMDRVDRPSKRKDLSKAQSSMSCTVDEIQKLCEALKTEPILWQALVRLLIDSGMRIGECVGLLWSNVDFDKARITVDTLTLRHKFITLRIEKVQNVVGIPNSGSDIVFGSLADGKVVVVGDQPPQSLQHPEEDSLFFGNQFLSKERIIEPIRRLVLGGQNDLAAKETVTAVVKRSQCPVAKAEEAYIKQPLIALFSLPFQIHPQFCCHNGFYIVGFGQGVHVQIIVQHEQLALQVGSGETVVFYFLDGSGVHVEPENGVHHHTDAAFALAALADQHKHFLPLGGGNQAVAQILLQGGNIFRLQQFRKEAQPVFRCRSISPIGYRQTVAAILFFLCKPTIQKTSAVRHMDTVTLQGQRVCICRQLQRFDYLLHRLCNLGMKPGRDFLINRALQFALIGRWAIHSIKAVVDTAHGMLGQEIPAVFRFDNFPLIINPNRVIHGIAPLSGEPAICGCIRLPLVRL